jgi:hypothetical protein
VAVPGVPPPRWACSWHTAKSKQSREKREGKKRERKKRRRREERKGDCDLQLGSFF